MMKIGIVLSLTPGYSETFFNSKIKGLLGNGIDVVIFCQKKNDDFKLCPVILSPKVSRNPLFMFYLFLGTYISLVPKLPVILKYIKIEKHDGVGFLQIFKKIYLNAHLLKAKVDWLHFGFATQALERETVAKAIGAKMAVSLRGFDINVYPLKHENCFNKLWRYVDKVHSISQYLVEKAWSLGMPQTVSFQIITPAINLEQLPQLENRAGSKPLKLATVARLNWIKGLETAIASMKILKESNIDFQYTIVGDGNTSESERYKFMVYEYGLQENIIFLGKIDHDETLKIISESDIYLQPSLNEGFCNAVLEAQAMGKLCIATNVGGLKENIADTESGWLVPSMNTSALAKKIITVFNMSEQSKMAISNFARKNVVKNYTIEKQQQHFIAFYS